jgi:PPOX class probable FMN-dependent enzyme
MSSSTVTSLEDLSAHYAAPAELVVKKQIDRLDEFCRRFIALSPFVCLSTADREGRVDCSPRGGAPGFVEVVDERTLLLPDRRGNNRVDSLKNVIANGHVGLLFLVPGIDETLRVNGPARIISDQDQMARMAVQGKAPSSALEVTADEIFFHCGKALKRSGLWSAEAQIERKDFPTLGEIVARQTRLISKEEGEAYVAESYAKRLY